MRRALFVDAAAVIVLQLLAAIQDADVPLLVFDKDHDVFVQQVPPNVVKFGALF